MKKRIAILICLFSITIPVVPVWGRESSELNLTAGATKQIDDILLNDISDFKFGWTRTSSNVRSQPDINSEIVMTLSFNEKIIVKDYNDKWNYVIINNQTYFIWKELVSEIKCVSYTHKTPYNKIKSYMSYECITSKSSDQYRLQQIAYTGMYGIRQVNGRFCVAVGSAYTTQIGQYIDLVLEDGAVISCILADCKADIHTDTNNILTSDGSLAEFVVDIPSLSKTVKYTGDISTTCEDWESMITEIIIYDKVEEF